MVSSSTEEVYSCRRILTKVITIRLNKIAVITLRLYKYKLIVYKLKIF